MEYILKTEKSIFNVADTLNCGQCFRFLSTNDADNEFVLMFKNKFLRLKQTENEVIFFDTTTDDFNNIWCDYFDISTNYSPMKELFSTDETLKKAIEFDGGIHILKQDNFEALISFIVSQNNNIPRIKGIIRKFCERFGEKIDKENYSFPTIKSLTGIKKDDLSGISLGYRDDYIVDCIEKIASKEIKLDEIKSMPIDEARKTLQKIKGVGPKVCECALLFGFNRLEAFPIDTWVKKVLAKYYQEGFPVEFEKYAGIAQQYLFHYIRSSNIF
ncbi:MAG: DNA glycosylase [Oscillospiraceae bacterium]